MQGISPQQLETLQTRLEGTQTALEAEEYANLTKDDVVGDLLQTGIQGYLAMTYAMDKLAAQASDIVYLRRPSYGTFSTHMEVAYLFGAPQTLQFSGVVMDADRVSMNTEHQGNCYEDWVAFNRSSGMRNSALEHQVPEQLFSTDENPAEGVSTAKALSVATTEGQKIYTLTSDNADQLDNITIDDGARAEIESGLSLGMEVTVHEALITVGGWTGSGYVILDPEYGIGAYKISGGESGGFAAIEYILGTISIFYGLLDASAGTLKTANPYLAKALQYMAIALFVQKLLKAGIQCQNQLDAVIFAVTIFALITLLVVDITQSLTNPLVAFGTGLALDAGFSALVSVSKNCSD